MNPKNHVKSLNGRHLNSSSAGISQSLSAVALLHDIFGENADFGCSDWVPLIDCNASSQVPVPQAEPTHLHHNPNSISGVSQSDLLVPVSSQSQRLSNSRSSSGRSVVYSPTLQNSHILDTFKHCDSFHVSRSSVQPWARTNEPRLKRTNVSPGPGTYSPKTASKSSIAVKFGRSVNHMLPFNTSCCEENFISHKAVPDESKLFGKGNAVSFPRRCRILQLTASASDQMVGSACSPSIGPGTYSFRSDMGSNRRHLIPLGPRGSDLRSFRQNRALKHTYGKEQNDAFIGVFACSCSFLF
jgi:hypothetical protein